MVAIRIEYAQRAHAAEIAAIEARSFTIAGHLLDAVTKSRKHDPGVRLVAITEERVRGYVASAWFYGQSSSSEVRVRHLSITALAVDAPFRHMGIGRRLLTALFERGGARGARSYHLMVQVENTNAITLYESLGFERSERGTGAYGPGLDGFAMMRPALPEDRSTP